MGVVERHRLPPTVARVLAWGRAGALRVHVVATGTEADDDVAAVDDLLWGWGAPRARRQGVRPSPSPAAANVLLVLGPLGGPEVLDAYHRLPHPKYVLHVGAQGRRETDADPVVPADLGLDGADESSLLAAFASLQELIRDEDPAARWARGPDRPVP